MIWRQKRLLIVSAAQALGVSYLLISWLRSNGDMAKTRHKWQTFNEGLGLHYYTTFPLNPTNNYTELSRERVPPLPLHICSITKSFAKLGDEEIT